MNRYHLSTTKSKIVTVYSPKKGAGCTTLAVNLACGLMSPDNRVLLMDVDEQNTDLDMMLYLPGGMTAAALKQHDVQLEFLEKMNENHLASLTDTMMLRTTPDQLPRMLAQVSLNYDFIVVDTGCLLDDFRMRLFEASDRIVMVMTPTLSSIRAVGKTLDMLNQSNTTKGKTQLVLNERQKVPLSNHKADFRQKLKQHLSLPVFAEIPADETTIAEAAHRNVPLIAYDTHQKKRITRSMLAMAYKLHDEIVKTAGV